MQHNTILSRFFLTLLVFGIIMWIGGSIVRMSTAYDLYIPFSKMELKVDYSDSARLQTVKLFAFSALYTAIGFSAAFFGYVLLGFYLRKYLRKYGWLLMALVLFLLAAPWGFFEMYLDLKLNFAVLEKTITFNSDAINDLFVSRFSKISIWAVISYLAAISSVITLIWRPLNKYAPADSEQLKKDEPSNDLQEEL